MDRNPLLFFAQHALSGSGSSTPTEIQIQSNLILHLAGHGVQAMLQKLAGNLPLRVRQKLPTAKH